MQETRTICNKCRKPNTIFYKIYLDHNTLDVCCYCCKDIIWWLNTLTDIKCQISFPKWEIKKVVKGWFGGIREETTLTEKPQWRTYTVQVTDYYIPPKILGTIRFY